MVLYNSSKFLKKLKLTAPKIFIQLYLGSAVLVKNVFTVGKIFAKITLKPLALLQKSCMELRDTELI